jgi:transcriptional regulator with XRE-family HTH domain
MSLFEYIAAKIREFRTQYGGKGISQETLADAMGVATNTISRWETATYQPTVQDIEKLARFFGKSVLEFFPQEKPTEDEQLNALLRAAKELDPADVEELRRYAEFRKARSLMSSTKTKGAGRPRGG